MVSEATPSSIRFWAPSRRHDGRGPKVSNVPAMTGVGLKRRAGVSREAFEKARRIELRTRHLVESLFSGEYHSIFNCRMPFDTSHQVARVVGVKTECSQRYALIQLHMFSNLTRFPNDNAGTVIDEKVTTDRGPRVNVDAGLLVCPFGHHSWDERDL